MVDHDLVARQAALGAHRPIDDVEQLADRNGRRAAQVRALVCPRVGDDQPLGRRHQRVKQHLAVLGARVAVADVGLGEQQVVAVAAGPARELAVVEPEDAHDPVRNRAHRVQRADRQVAGAEVRPRRAPAKAIGEQHADVGELELGAASRRRLAGIGVDVAEQALELATLPGLALAGSGERVGGLGDRGRSSVRSAAVGSACRRPS